MEEAKDYSLEHPKVDEPSEKEELTTTDPKFTVVSDLESGATRTKVFHSSTSTTFTWKCKLEEGVTTEFAQLSDSSRKDKTSVNLLRVKMLSDVRSHLKKGKGINYEPNPISEFLMEKLLEPP